MRTAISAALVLIAACGIAMAGQDQGTAQIAYNGGQPDWDPTPVVMSLDPGDWFDVEIKKFPLGTRIESIEFYLDKEKTQIAGTWDRATGMDASLARRFIVAAWSDSLVRVTGNENTGDEVVYWYNVIVEAPNGATWTLDPKIRNVGRRGWG